MGQGKPPGEPHRQILLAPGELCPHRCARAGGGEKMSVSPNNNYVAESQNWILKGRNKALMLTYQEASLDL